MKRGRRRLALALGPSAVVVLCLGATEIMAACGSSDALTAKGGACFQASECQPGLVCVPQKGGGSVCTDDLSGVAGKPPPDGAAADANLEAGEASTDGPVDTDTGADTGTDTGSPPADAGDEG